MDRSKRASQKGCWDGACFVCGGAQSRVLGARQGCGLLSGLTRLAGLTGLPCAAVDATRATANGRGPGVGAVVSVRVSVSVSAGEKCDGFKHVPVVLRGMCRSLSSLKSLVNAVRTCVRVVESRAMR